MGYIVYILTTQHCQQFVILENVFYFLHSALALCIFRFLFWLDRMASQSIISNVTNKNIKFEAIYFKIINDEYWLFSISIFVIVKSIVFLFIFYLFLLNYLFVLALLIREKKRDKYK